MKQLKIKIMSNGEIEAETLGMKGKSCLKYIEELERITNSVACDSDFTKEYYQEEEQQSISQEQGVSN